MMMMTTVNVMMMILALLLILLNLITALPRQGQTAPVLTAGPATSSQVDFTSEAFIKKMRFQVPETSRVGDLRKLSCAYELSGASLHAMKLFKDDKEFYRYTPAQLGDDTRITFAQPGLRVDLVRSNDHDIWIKIIDRRAQGVYKCQVSVEDTFKSISAEKRMDVLEKARTVPGNSEGMLASWLGSSSAASSALPQQQQQQLNQRHTVQQQQQQPKGRAHSSMQSSQSLLKQHQQSNSAAATAAALLAKPSSLILHSLAHTMLAILVLMAMMMTMISARPPELATTSAAAATAATAAAAVAAPLPPRWPPRR